MTITYKAAEESTAYRPEGRTVHAVACTEGEPATMTVCGMGVPGDPYGDFATTILVARCGSCAAVLRIEYLKR
jgi:hypothetical protein